MQIEKKHKTRKELLTEKETAVKKAEKPAYIYEMIDWCEKMKTQDDPIYKEDYEKLETTATSTLLKRIAQAPKAKNWSEEIKTRVNEHIARLREINNKKIKELEDEYLAAQKAKEDFKLKRIEEKINEYKLSGVDILKIYKKIMRYL